MNLEYFYVAGRSGNFSDCAEVAPKIVIKSVCCSLIFEWKDSYSAVLHRNENASSSRSGIRVLIVNEERKNLMILLSD